MILETLVEKHKAIQKPLSYLLIYEQLFLPIREKILSVLEIGVARGCSLRVWADFFPNAIINGIDLKLPSEEFGSRFKIFQGDQSDKIFLQRVMDAASPFDVIIDDGSHKPFDWHTSFFALFPALKPGGIYAIEDLMAPTHQGWDPVEKDYIESCLTDICYPLLSQVKVSGKFEWIVLRPHLFLAKKGV